METRGDIGPQSLHTQGNANMLRTMTIALLAALFGVGCVGCGMDVTTVQGSGTRASETRQVDPFSAVDSVGAEDVTITIGAQQSITVEADDNILPLIETKVSNGRLRIG